MHRSLGPGLLESAYEHCLCYELCRRGVLFKRQVPVPILYRDVVLDCGYRLDLLVEDSVIVELKSVEKLTGLHSAQLITYLRLARKPAGLLINFNVRVLLHGVRRAAN